MTTSQALADFSPFVLSHQSVGGDGLVTRQQAVDRQGSESHAEDTMTCHMCRGEDMGQTCDTVLTNE